jgi:hypothetical protein
MRSLHALPLQLGERAMPKSSAQYTMQDLEVSSDTDESFLGAPASCCSWSCSSCTCASRVRLTRPRGAARAAIAKRVLGLLTVAVGGGALLFYLGLSSLRVD